MEPSSEGGFLGDGPSAAPGERAYPCAYRGVISPNREGRPGKRRRCPNQAIPCARAPMSRVGRPKHDTTRRAPYRQGLFLLTGSIVLPPYAAFPAMIPRSKLARNLAATARRSVLASRQYASAVSAPSSSEAAQTRHISQAKANSTVNEVQTRGRRAERNGHADISAAMTET